MAVLQSRIGEIRVMKRQNLEEEAKIVGNYYRDILRQYGIDCNYYKIKVPYLEVFKPIIDENNKTRSAYGYEPEPDYSISTDMITYMEVSQDIMQLQNYGVFPDMDVNFYFDSKDFACQLAYKLGRLKEYPIKNTSFVMEVPQQVSDFILYDIDQNGYFTLTSLHENKFMAEDGYYESSWVEISSYSKEEPYNFISSEQMSMEDYKKNRTHIHNEISYLSDSVFPYGIGYGMPEYYYSDILSGKFTAKLDNYELDKVYTIMCRPYQHGDVDLRIPVNDTIYKSFDHVFANKEFVDTMLFLTYKVSKISAINEDRYILSGFLHGSVLFHDITKIGKYMEMIHPDVGDIITIDFPDENNRQQFEITDCNDKNLANDGINPLLHRYVWKCKARRYVNSGEGFPEINESNERWKEKMDFLNVTDEIIAKDISMYDEDHDDDVYGGYERKLETYDKNVIDKLSKRTNFDFIDDGGYIELFEFYDHSRLITDGYELFFITKPDENNRTNSILLTLVDDNHTINENLVASDIQYLKASDDQIYFINFDNKVQRLCDDEEFSQGETELCLNSMLDLTHKFEDNNVKGGYYFKFNETNTVIMSLNNHLYCRFGNSKRKMIKLC